MLHRASRKVTRRSLSKLSNGAQHYFHSNAVLSQAVPAVVTAPKPSGVGILERIFGRKKSFIPPPLNEPLPGVREPPLFVAPTQISTEVTTFDNGFRVASEDVPGPSTVAAVYLNCGAAYENPKVFGVSQLLDKMAFKSTLNRSNFRLVREMEAIGSHYKCNISRDSMSYAANGIRAHLPEIVEILADTIINPAFHEWEIKEQIKIIQSELKNLSNYPQMIVGEALISTAYDGPLSNSLISDPSKLSSISVDDIRAFIEDHLVPSKMVFAASGANHKELVSLCEPLFSTLPTKSPIELKPSNYIGGDWRNSAPSKLTHVALGFEAHGGWENDRDGCIASVVQVFMGGGGAFSAGGPGKGLHSSLYKNVLSKYQGAESCIAFSDMFEKSGIIGVYSTALPDQIQGLMGVVVSELIKLADSSKISESDLQRAKNSTIGSVYMLLESKVAQVEDIGRQILTYGHRKEFKEFIDIINSITKEEISNYVSKFLGSPLTLVSYGDVSNVPHYDVVSRVFRE